MPTFQCAHTRFGTPARHQEYLEFTWADEAEQLLRTQEHDAQTAAVEPEQLTVVRAEMWMSKEAAKLKEECRRLRAEASHKQESHIEAAAIRNLITDEIEQTYDPSAPDDENLAKITAKIRVL